MAQVLPKVKRHANGSGQNQTRHKLERTMGSHTRRGGLRNYPAQARTWHKCKMRMASPSLSSSMPSPWAEHCAQTQATTGIAGWMSQGPSARTAPHTRRGPCAKRQSHSYPHVMCGTRGADPSEPSVTMSKRGPVQVLKVNIFSFSNSINLSKNVDALASWM